MACEDRVFAWAWGPRLIANDVVRVSTCASFRLYRMSRVVFSISRCYIIGGKVNFDEYALGAMYVLDQNYIHG